LTRSTFIEALTDLGVRVTSVSYSWDPSHPPHEGYLFAEEGGLTKASYCERGICDEKDAYVATEPSEVYGYVLERVEVFHGVSPPALADSVGAS
jgi:hypothetical protein